LAVAGTRGISAVVVAKAAVDRLGWRPPEGVETEVLESGIMLPQVGQGALAVECRRDDDAVRSLLEEIDDPGAGAPVAAERAYLAALGGGCTLPVGAYGDWAPDRQERSGGVAIRLTAMIASADGRIALRHTDTGTDPEALGREMARYLLDDAGGRDLGEWAAAPGEVLA
jgi:hydroxymethylbilane synthase